jgi:hypothetical protein
MRLGFVAGRNIMSHETRNAIALRLALGALVAGSVTLVAAIKGPDAGGYTATDSAVYSFIDVAGSGGTSVLNGIDDGLAELTLPFSFQFYGQTYSILCVSSNGALYFVANAGVCGGFNDFSNTDLTSTNTPNDLPAVLPFWSDLTFDVQGAGGVFYRTSGSTGSRKFVVQWNNAYPQGVPTPVTFQAVLMEGSNNILFQYQTVDAGGALPAANGGAATIGIRNHLALTNQEQTQWSFGVPVVTNSSALLFASTAGSLTAHMHGAGDLESTAAKYHFDFDVQNRDDHKSNRLMVHVDYVRRGQPSDEFVASTIEQISFTDDPGVSPNKDPKKNGADTLTFTGTGRWNKTRGYTFTVQAVDKGEPGKNKDTFAMTIFSPTGEVVATMSGPITAGNVEASSTRAQPAP